MPVNHGTQPNVPTLFVANSHSWLYERLTEDADLDGVSTRITETRRAADIILYLDPPWPDADAPDRKLAVRDRFRVYVYSQNDVPIPWAPGAYASIPASRSSPATTGSFYVAHHLREDDGLSPYLESARDTHPDFLWSFVGAFSNHPIRRRLGAIEDPDGLVRDAQRFSDTVRWAWKTRYRDEAQTAFSSYAESIGRSSFVVCPRGVGAASIRLFEAMQVGRCPVVISDEWLPPPSVDWSSCSVRIAEDELEELPDILRARSAEAATLGVAARAVWERFFAPERQLATLVSSCSRVDGSVPARLVCLEKCATTPAVARRLLRDRHPRLARAWRRWASATSS
jgi:hypothetical protein